MAWLALGELNARTAAALRAHIETCDGCRRYLAEISTVTERLAAAEMTPDIQASESFHRRLVTRLKTPESHAWVGAGQGTGVSPLTPSLSPSDGERVPVRAGEGKAAGIPGFLGSGKLRLGAEQPGAVWQALVAPFVAARLNWRVALSVAGAAALVITLLSILARQPAALPPAPTVVQAVLPPDINSDLPPTIANYQRIASHSLDDLDELLTMQGKRNPSPTPIYTASLFALAHASD
jgi:Putative zinc-finger